MADSVREKILANLETELKEVVGVRTVVRGTLDPTSLEPPSISIIEAGDDVETLIHPLTNRRLTIFLRLWIMAQTDRSKKLNIFLADVQKKMMEDTLRGGNAIDTLEGNNRNVYLEGIGATEAGADIDYSILYRTKLTDPYAAS